MSVVVNDIHARLNESTVSDIIPVNDLEAVQAAVLRAANEGRSIAIAGGRHAMGGQQFCADGLLLDTRGMDRVLGFDVEEGTIEVEAGMQWPALIEHLVELQEHGQHQWGIAQKQTGADRLSIGGALAANVHGRGLTMRPMIADVESFVLVDPSGNPVTCSRDERPELFPLAIGGYGLFGCIYSARIRLLPRRTLERVVEVRLIEELAGLFEDRIANGFLYGDFQFATDDATDDFLRRGVFSCYRPIEYSGAPPADQRALSDDDWRQLIYLAHTDKAEAFERYATYYLTTSGQIYYSDAHQLAGYTDDYHAGLDALLKAPYPSTEMISEIYVPRERLGDFMAAAAEQVRSNGANVIYGTIRLIERDEESVLAWATDRWACIIFNLCVPHTPDGIDRAAEAFRGLIDLAIERGGKYYLTYHRWARRDQVETCYPQFVEFLRAKRSHDPDGRFESDWYRHYAAMFADELE
jgi:FAD/FMN-containing dehydrogenase